MRVGSLVYATDQGLGILAKSFYDHGIVTDVMVVRHGRHPTHDEWYPDAPQIASLNVQNLTQLLPHPYPDVMLFFETPFVWPLIDYCRKVGVKTVLMPMHECLHHNVWSHLPDLFLCPSLLDQKVIGERLDPKTFIELDRQAPFLSVPVDVPWRQRTKAEVFVHNAGHGGLRGRNGTAELLQALRYVKSPTKFIIRSQKPLGIPPDVTGRVSVLEGTFARDIIWEQGDVFIFPEKFNGLSLPLQEARAAGMLVMCGDRFPMNIWLPNKVECSNCDGTGTVYCGGASMVMTGDFGCKLCGGTGSANPLIPVQSSDKGQRIGPPYQSFDEAVFDPKDIAATIDAWYGTDISRYSEEGRLWAEQNSWAVLGPKYKTVLEDLCNGRA